MREGKRKSKKGKKMNIFLLLFLNRRKKYLTGYLFTNYQSINTNVTLFFLVGNNHTPLTHIID